MILISLNGSIFFFLWFDSNKIFKKDTLTSNIQIFFLNAPPPHPNHPHPTKRVCLRRIVSWKWKYLFLHQFLLDNILVNVFFSSFLYFEALCTHLLKHRSYFKRDFFNILDICFIFPQTWWFICKPAQAKASDIIRCLSIIENKENNSWAEGPSAEQRPWTDFKVFVLFLYKAFIWLSLDSS